MIHQVVFLGSSFLFCAVPFCKMHHAVSHKPTAGNHPIVQPNLLGNCFNLPSLMDEKDGIQLLFDLRSQETNIIRSATKQHQDLLCCENMVSQIVSSTQPCTLETCPTLRPNPQTHQRLVCAWKRQKRIPSGILTYQQLWKIIIFHESIICKWHNCPQLLC